MSFIRNRILNSVSTLIGSIRTSKGGVLIGKTTAGAGFAQEIDIDEVATLIGADLGLGLTHANTIYVAESGTDTRTGLDVHDFSNPFLTVTAAQAAASSGDTILVLPGDYSAETVLAGKDGVTYQGLDGAILPGFDVTTAITVKGSGLCQSLTCRDASAVMDMPGMDTVDFIYCPSGTQTTGNAGTYIDCFGGTQTAGNAGTFILCDSGTQTAGNAGTYIECNDGTQTAGNAGTYIYCEGGTQTAGNAGSYITCNGFLGGSPIQTAGNAGSYITCNGFLGGSPIQTAGNAGTFISCDSGGTQTAGNAGTYIACTGGDQTIRLTDQSHDGTTVAPVYLSINGSLNLYGNTSTSTESGGTVVSIANSWSGSLFIDGVTLKATTVATDEATTGITYGTGVTGTVTLKDCAITTAEDGTGEAKAIDAPSAQTVKILGTFSSTHAVGANITLVGVSIDDTGNLKLGGGYTEGVVAIGDSGASKTIALTSGTFQTVSLTDNCTFTMPTATAGKSFILKVLTVPGSFTATFTGVKWSGGSAPTITTTAAKYDLVSFVADGTAWSGSIIQNYNA